jgi:hypothetical protein
MSEASRSAVGLDDPSLIEYEHPDRLVATSVDLHLSWCPGERVGSRTGIEAWQLDWRGDAAPGGSWGWRSWQWYW